ncbi:sigma-70 family RNA polymerase sigma factor [Streptomyces sp. NPDC088812]|uniref:sigma-70 family RNA polymerase sigma factor n=1 Tax=Streptomyces sp. NPDC088812 TaxID=3365905 RepID=UPI00382CB256
MRQATDVRQDGPVSVAPAWRHLRGRTPAEPAAPAGTDCEPFVRMIYEEYGGVLTRFAARLLGGDRDRAEDILQEAAVRAWRHVGVLGRQDGGLRPWLFTVVRNLVIDERRASLVRPVTACPLDHVVIPVGDGAERVLTRHVVTDALHDLTAQQRQILHHMYFLGHSVAETSEVLGIAQGTVKSRTYYAVRALGNALRDRGIHA